MKVFLNLISLALFGAAAGVSAHTDLRGGAVVLADLADDASADAKGKPDFFPPEEMDEEEKKNKAQKRQDQRDKRRARDNPNRSQSEEEGERDRKNRQSRSRDNACTDPSDPFCGDEDYTRGRERGRQTRCNRNGESCNYHRSQNDPNPRRNRVDRDCINDCDRYYYDDGAVQACERRCSSIISIKDVKYIIGFLEEYKDHEFIADFLGL